MSLRVPDGSQTISSICGTIIASSYLTLHNILYIPSFHVKLISIAKLLTSNNCVVQFNVNSCHIMQNNSKEMIGIANLQRGLYVFNSIGQHSSYSSITNTSYNLWNLRLRHISDLDLQVISIFFPLVSCKNKYVPCDSCHFTKQRKLLIPNSTTRSSAPFDILHTDLWGPFSTMLTLGHKYFLTLVDDYTQYTWVIFLKTKNQTKSRLI